MAEPPRKDLKRPFFVAWLAFCLALVVLVWVDNLGPGETAAPQPGFVRSTVPVSTPTPPAQPTATSTPEPILIQDAPDD